jgi:hypothetical protein
MDQCSVVTSVTMLTKTKRLRSTIFITYVCLVQNVKIEILIILHPKIITGLLKNSVVDPDPYVLWPPGSAFGSVSHKYGSGSGSFHHQAKIVKKPLFLLLCDFFMTLYQCSGSASGSVKTEVRIRGSGSVPKCHGSTTLLKRRNTLEGRTVH